MLQAPLTPSAFPPDAVAVIYRPARSVMTSGLANTRRWKLRFERHSAPFIQPLMGWSGGDDMLSQVELTFRPLRRRLLMHAVRDSSSWYMG
jgi:hypothetical protein